MNQRQKLMEQYIFEKKEVTMYELVKHFNVSMNTIRSDIRTLEKKKVVEKIYGGVKSTSNTNFTAFDIRRTKNLEQKMKIAHYASRLIEQGDVVFVDSGTTLMYILDEVADNLEFTVITHNYSVISAAINKPKITLISLPGTFERKTRSYFDTTTSEILKKYNISKSFLAATTVSSSGNLCNTSYVESDIKRVGLEIAAKSYLLVDSSKFGKSALMTYGSLKDCDCVITDEGVPDYIEHMSLEYGVELVIV